MVIQKEGKATSGRSPGFSCGEQRPPRAVTSYPEYSKGEQGQHEIGRPASGARTRCQNEIDQIISGPRGLCRVRIITEVHEIEWDEDEDEDGSMSVRRESIDDSARQ